MNERLFSSVPSTSTIEAPPAQAPTQNTLSEPRLEPQSVEELELLLDLSKKAKHFAMLELTEQQKLLSQLESYECHSQVISLLNWRRAHRGLSRDALIQDGLWILRSQYHGLERFDDFVESGSMLIHAQRMSYDEIKILIAEGILGEDNWLEQSQFFKKCVESVVDIGHKVSLLERLALIYEKKLFLENEVEPVYRRVIKLDPHNPKARRFFKMWYMQAMKWKDVAENLEALVEGARNEHERQRAAHELAQLYLYNLNNPRKAREVLRAYCRDSELDIRQTLIEALERLELFDELIGELKKMEMGAEVGDEQARVKQKLGLVYLRAKRPRDAVDSLRECLVHNPELLLAYESLINALIEAGQATQVVSVLEQLRPNVKKDASREALEGITAKVKAMLPTLLKHSQKN